ncbi:MAG: PEP-CTERM sorting domain-containing protein [Sphingobium sp.]|nr:PEP-CTERM sorting domain-containing protein [Sphingobium sp.]
MFPVAAHATSYTDENAWRLAVSNVYALETFDAIPALSDVTTLPALHLRFLPLDDGTQPTVQPYSSTGGVVKSGPNNLLNDRDYSLPGRGPINVTPLSASDFLFGLGLWNVGGDDQLRLTFYDANDNIIEQVTSSISFGFFGIVNSAGAARAQVDFIAGNGYAPTDDWQTAVRGTFIPDVPEPASWALIIAGFAVVGTALRRRCTHVSFV